AASPETAKKQVDPLLEYSFKLKAEIHQIVASAEQRNGMSVVAIKKAQDAKGYKTVTHKFHVRSPLKGQTEESYLTQTKKTDSVYKAYLPKQESCKEDGICSRIEDIIT
uniref:H15 domain-containing protein n=1 Tax=Callorhinchus milii TaxID=7868 RepID=A0A4W3GCQ9_CALMI